MDDIAKLYQKHEEHSEKFGQKDKEVAVLQQRVSHLERSSDEVCRQITALRTELASAISPLALTLHQIQQVQSEDRGARNANKQSINYFAKFIEMIPTLVIIAGGIMYAFNQAGH